jgi:glycosyltransferase involved in cell wall biosynthesis
VSTSAPDFSVVVPTRDRPERLARCLAALERQRGASVEVVVVDDGSARADEVSEAVARCPRARVIHQKTAGPAAARNAGARGARAPFVGFTDDDCEPAPDWAARLWGRLREGADALAGTTVNARPRDPRARASQIVTDYVSQRALEQPSRTSFAPSNNIACTAELLGSVPFDERYRAAGGEDRDWCARLVAQGYELVVEPRAVVAHHQELTLRDFLRHHVRYGRGAYRFHRAHRSGRTLEPPRFYGGLLRRGFAQGVVPGALVCLSQAATAVGFLREALDDAAHDETS